MIGKRFKLALISGFLLWFVTTSTLAANEPWYSCLSGNMSAPFGWYVEGNVGSSTVSNKSYGGGSKRSSRLAGNINAGYKFMPYFAMELGATYYSIVVISVGGMTAANDRHYSFDLAGKVIFPLNTSGFEVFTKVGVVRLVSKVSLKNEALANSIGLSPNRSASTSLFLGLGAQYYFTPELAGVVQWQRANGSTSTGRMDLLSLGFSYLFDWL